MNIKADLINGSEHFAQGWNDRPAYMKLFGQAFDFEQGIIGCLCRRGPVAGQVLNGETGLAPAVRQLRKAVQFERRARHCGDQRFCVSVFGLAQDLRCRAAFDHFALIHDRHPVSGVGDHAHIVGDQDHADLPFAGQLFDQIQNLRLN